LFKYIQFIDSSVTGITANSTSSSQKAITGITKRPSQPSQSHCPAERRSIKLLTTLVGGAAASFFCFFFRVVFFFLGVSSSLVLYYSSPSMVQHYHLMVSSCVHTYDRRSVKLMLTFYLMKRIQMTED